MLSGMHLAQVISEDSPAWLYLCLLQEPLCLQAVAATVQQAQHCSSMARNCFPRCVQAPTDGSCLPPALPSSIRNAHTTTECRPAPFSILNSSVHAFLWSCCFVHHSSSSMFPECAQPLLIKAKARRGNDLCVEQTCRSMDAVSQGTLLANSSHMLLYSLIVWLLYIFPKEFSRWMGVLPVHTHDCAEL